ncbi:hypothetical protein EV561_10283 [Rhizobium sp. BK376]|nr:hypothetical protein EV561_10283 [Rhizobium sp. BK376]
MVCALFCCLNQAERKNFDRAVEMHSLYGSLYRNGWKPLSRETVAVSEIRSLDRTARRINANHEQE